MSTGSSAPQRGCLGFGLDTDIHLALSRAGHGAPLRVRVGQLRDRPKGRLLLQWRARENHPFEARVHAVDDEFEIWIGGLGCYVTSPERMEILVPPFHDAFVREQRLWGIPAALLVAARGNLAIHSAAVDLGGSSVVIAGPSHAGKTTMAAAFHAAGYRLLSEDLTALRVGDRPVVYPGPAAIRLRRDVAARLHLADAAAERADQEKVHMVIDEARRGSAEPVPLAAVLLVERHDTYGLTDLPPSAALAALWKLTANLPTDQGRERAFTGLAALTSAVPVVRLRRPWNIAAIGDLVPRVLADLRCAALV